jgi:hypothetical protein
MYNTCIGSAKKAPHLPFGIENTTWWFEIYYFVNDHVFVQIGNARCHNFMTQFCKI